MKFKFFAATACAVLTLAGGTAASAAVTSPATGTTTASLAAPSNLHQTLYYNFGDFAWGSVAGATSYDFQVTNAAGSVQVYRQSESTVHATNVPLSPSTTYKWRVASKPNGSWSAFKTISTPAAPPPSNGTCTAQLNGGCPKSGTYQDPDNFVSENTSMAGTYVDNQGLTGSGVTAPTANETVTGPETWDDEVNATSDQGAVLMYPAVVNSLYSVGGAPDYLTTPSPLSDYSSLTSSYSTTMPSSGANAEAGYDIWTDKNTATEDDEWNGETMIWTDATAGRLDSSAGNACGYTKQLQSDVSFGGSNGVAKQSWDLCVIGTVGDDTNDDEELIWVPSNLGSSGANAGTGSSYSASSSGSVDILSMLNYEVSKGYLSSDIGISQINYGFEICGTTGTQDFAVSKFTLSDK